GPVSVAIAERRDARHLPVEQMQKPNLHLQLRAACPFEKTLHLHSGCIGSFAAARVDATKHPALVVFHATSIGIQHIPFVEQRAQEFVDAGGIHDAPSLCGAATAAAAAGQREAVSADSSVSRASSQVGSANRLLYAARSSKTSRRKQIQAQFG